MYTCWKLAGVMSMILMRDMDQTKSPEWRLREALRLAPQAGKTGTVVMEDIKILLSESLVVPAHVSLVSEGRGNRATRLVAGSNMDVVLVADQAPGTQQSYGQVFSDFEIRPGANCNAPFIAIDVVNNSSCRWQDIKVDCPSVPGCTGIRIRGRESQVFDGLAISNVQTCVDIKWGDNLTFRHFDMNAANPSSGSFGTIFRFGRANHYTIDGGTTQECGCIIDMSQTVDRTCQNLSVSNMRCEQMVEANVPGINIDPILMVGDQRRPVLETLNMYGVRLSPNRLSVPVFINPLAVMLQSLGANWI